jgi:glycosyltransferase involved in cell wall biosynthesis
MDPSNNASKDATSSLHNSPIKLSFIIPAYNEERYILDCLRSIYSHGDLPPFEVIVVDNGSTDRTVELVRNTFPTAIVVLEHDQKGPAAARNAGAKVARGKLFAFIDADCRLPASWWSNVQKAFSQENAMLIFGPYRYYEAKTFWKKAMFHMANVWFVQLGFRLGLLFGKGGPGFGGNTVVRQEAFQMVGGFDDRFAFYGEDVDFVKKVSSRGKVVFSPTAWVYSSDRRFRKEGVVKMWAIYTLNGLWVMLFGKPLYEKHRHIR